MANDTYDTNEIIREVLRSNIDISPSDRGEWKLFCCALKVLGYDQSTFVALSSGKQSDSVKAWREERNPARYLNEWQAKAKIVALAKNAGLDVKPFLLHQPGENRPTDRHRQHRNRPRTSTPQRKPLQAPTAPKPVNPNVYYIPKEMIEQGATQVQETGLYKFLCNEFDRGEVEEVLRKYKVGASKYTTNEGLRAVSFPLINREGNCIDCKIFHIDPETGSRKTAPPLMKGDGKHRQDLKSTFALAMMKDPDNPGKRLNERRDQNWAYFGEHLLKDLNPDNSVIGIVESEKTALILSVAYPSVTWIATGSISNLTPERFAPYFGFNCTIYPDRDGYDKWKDKAKALALQGYKVKVDTTILTYPGSPKDDLADIVLRSKNGTQEQPTDIPTTYQPHTDTGTDLQEEPFYTDSDPEPPVKHSPEWNDWLVRRICRNYKEPQPDTTIPTINTQNYETKN